MCYVHKKQQTSDSLLLFIKEIDPFMSKSFLAKNNYKKYFILN